MRAVAIRAFGAAPELLDLPTPRPGAHELLVRVAAAGLNPFDWKIADGILKGRPTTFPLVLGVDAAGTVEAIGGQVTGFRVGDRLFGSFLHDPVGTGTYAEFALVPEGNAIAAAPKGVDLVEAAGLPTAAMTALEAVELLSLADGSSLLVVGASGGVGGFAVQIAARRGARVLATGRAESAGALRSLGAAEVVDPDPTELERAVRRMAPSGIDGLLDLVDEGERFERATGWLRSGGVAVTTRYAAKPKEMAARGLRGVNLDLHPSAELLRRVAAAVDSGELTVPKARRIGLADAAAALESSRAGTMRGKTVVVP